MADLPNIFDNIDVSVFPLPQVVEETTAEDLFRERVAAFREADPNYDLLLESDPAAKVMQAAAYREFVQRQRINFAVRQTCLAFGVGDNLDRIIGDFLGVARMLITPENLNTYPVTPAVYEDDERYRLRLQIRASAVSTAGGVGHYKFHALSADVRVADVAVYSPNHYPYYNTGGLVAFAVMSNVGNLIPTQDILDNVRDRVTSPNIKVLTDIIVVEAAVMRSVDVTAEVYLLPTTPLTVFNGLEQKLRDAVSAKQKLGWDLTPSWISAQLQVGGVHSVTIVTPLSTSRIPANEFASLGSVSIIFKGFSDFEADEIAEMEKRRLTRLMYDHYIAYAISYRRTATQIAEDLVYKEKAGVIQPTVIGLVRHLQLDTLYSIADFVTLSEASLASVCWYYLASNNGYLPEGTSNIINVQ